MTTQERFEEENTMEQNVVEIIAEALTHARTKKMGEDASHITKKMIALVESEKSLSLEEYREGVRKRVEAKFGGLLYPFGSKENEIRRKHLSDTLELI